MDEKIAVVFQTPSFDKSREVRAKLFDLQAGNITSEILSMSADISDTA